MRVRAVQETLALGYQGLLPGSVDGSAWFTGVHMVLSRSNTTSFGREAPGGSAATGNEDSLGSEAFFMEIAAELAVAIRGEEAGKR